MKLSSVFLALALADLCFAQESILQTVANSPDHNTLEVAVLAASAEVAETLLNGSLNLTLFAPDDAAFDTLPNGTVELLTSAPWQPHLTCVLAGHTYLGGAVASSSVTGPLTVESAEEDFELNLDLTDATVTVNGIQVSTPDIIATNGVVHSLSAGVLLPECVTENIPALLTAEGEFTNLLNLVGAAGLSQALSEPPTSEGLTLMAPNDEAFGKVPQDVLDFISGNVTALREVLSYHVIPSNFIPSESAPATTLQGGDIDVVVSDSGIVLNNASTVEGTHLASNGIYHEVSEVLLPPTFSIPTIPPTAMPTQAPTQPPTLTPSITPSQSPSHVPTEKPSEVPTQTPSQKPTENPSILDTVVASDIHNTLEAAVVAAPSAIAELLDNDMTNLTLFAPDDTAFATLGETANRLTSPPWQPHLACVLQGHLYTEGAVPSSAITGPLTITSAQEGYDLNLNLDGTTVTVNDIAVSAADIESSNGFIHSLSDGVLLPPCVTNNLPAALTAAGSFGTLLNLAEDLSEALSGPPNPFGLTLLAPNNDAFLSVPQSALIYLTANDTALEEVLSYHVLLRNYIPTESGTISTLQGDDIIVTVDGDTISLNGIMVERTILASNGIIHEIGSVLIPPSLVIPGLTTAMPTATGPATPMPTPGPATPEPTPSRAAKKVSNVFVATFVGVVTLLL